MLDWHDHVMSGEGDPQRLLEARQRLHALEALDLLQRSWNEVLSIVFESATSDDARQRIVSSFPVDAEQATIMLGVQVSRLTEADRQRVAAEIAEVQERIGDFGGGTTRP